IMWSGMDWRGREEGGRRERGEGRMGKRHQQCVLTSASLFSYEVFSPWPFPTLLLLADWPTCSPHFQGGIAAQESPWRGGEVRSSAATLHPLLHQARPPVRRP